MLPVIVGGLLETGLRIIDKIIPDPQARDQAKLDFLKLQQEGEFKELELLSEGDKSQADINTTEAQNGNLFVSGWRPAVGWVCVCGLFYQLMFRPIASWIMESIYLWKPAPTLELDTLLTLLFGMLGLGAYRTIEKTKGVAR